MTLTCPHCCDPSKKKTFPDNYKLKNHVRNFHRDFSVNFVDIDGIKQISNIKRNEKDQADCPICAFQSNSASGMRSHIKREHETDDRSGSSSDESDAEIEPAQVPPPIDSVQIPAPPEPIVKNISRRQNDEAVLHACNMLDKSSAEQSKSLWIVDTLKLRPFSIIDAHGAEQNALTHDTHISKVTRSEPAPTLSIILPEKRKWECSCDQQEEQKKNPVALSEILNGPYRRKLFDFEFAELSEEIAELLNEDWNCRPQLKYFCAQLFAGSILLRQGEALLILCVESYGRTKSLDAHQENFINKSSISPPTSLPPPKTRYTNVWPTTTSDADGTKLIIGTKCCSVLVTSSLRIDTNLSPSIGASTNTFVLKSHNDSLATQIFFDLKSIEKAFALAKHERTNKLHNYDLVYQLRQLRSKFHQQSTYFLCRCSSVFTDDHRSQPYTLFTLCDHDNEHSSNGKVASSLFKAIALNVIHDSSPTLPKQTVKHHSQRCSEGYIKGIIDNILDLYGEDKEHIEIIGNEELNSKLTALAARVQHYLKSANGSITDNIKCMFAN